MFDELVHHLYAVENEVNKLSFAGAAGFALASAERQWPVYERASKGKPWSIAPVRITLDQAWTYVIDDLALPSNFVEQCHLSCPPDDFPSDATVAAAHLISHSMIDLFSAIRGGETDYFHYPAARNIDLLEMLGDEIPSDNINTEFEVIVAQEVEKQKLDLNSIQQSSNPSQLRRIRESSKASSLFNELWFPE